MPDAHLQFLIGFEKGEPNWALIGLPKAADLPAVRWRQQNVDKSPAEKRAALMTHLADVPAIDVRWQ